jgi:hypothetical protein
MTKSIFITIAIAFALTGCFGKSNQGIAPAPIPKDEATGAERAQIDSALNQISDLSEKFGKRREFKDMPIIVTSDDPKKTGIAGYCSSAPFIALSRFLFSENTPDSLLVTTLLHEIGHCYFGLGHTDEWISKPGYSFVFYKTDPKHPGMSVYPEICVTIMCSRGLEPGQLLEYYVGVLLGQPKAKSVTDLERFTELKYIAK